MLFIGPHQPCLAYVADVLPGLGEEGVQTCTLRDLVAEGAAATTETDPDVARPKSSAGLVKAVEAAVRFYEQPPAKGMTAGTAWSDIWPGTGDWAGAFEAPEPGTPHNEARAQILDALVTILLDKHDGDVPAALLRTSLRQSQELRTALNGAWPLLEAADLIADLWSVRGHSGGRAGHHPHQLLTFIGGSNEHVHPERTYPSLHATGNRGGRCGG